jgi:hypothetical protein
MNELFLRRREIISYLSSAGDDNECNTLAWSYGYHGMIHIAIHEQLEGQVVEWMEQVSDEQYRK